MDALQIPGAPVWRNISARTSYTNKNLVIADLILDEENQFRLIAIDASRLKSKSLEMVLDATLAGGTVAGSVAELPAWSVAVPVTSWCSNSS